jgi:oxygen-independent coproporphyrinogen-3 oxidase
MGMLLKTVRDYCPTVSEITVEGNPDSLCTELMSLLHDHGVSRVSVGVQSIDQAVLRQIGRASFDPKVLDEIRRQWPGSLSIDLMTDTPGSSVETVLRTARFAVSCGANHVSAYVLTPEAGTPLAAAIAGGLQLPESDALDQCAAVLLDSGFTRYEVSNFAEPGHECRHNMYYWQPASYLGFGASAASTLYRSDGAIRFSASENIARAAECLSPFSAEVTETLSLAELRSEYLMLRLRTAAGIALGEYERRFGSDLLVDYSQEIARLSHQGVVVIRDGVLRVSAASLSFADAAVRALL